jgi:hypothetical protein
MADIGDFAVKPDVNAGQYGVPAADLQAQLNESQRQQVDRLAQQIGKPGARQGSATVRDPGEPLAGYVGAPPYGDPLVEGWDQSWGRRSSSTPPAARLRSRRLGRSAASRTELDLPILPPPMGIGRDPTQVQRGRRVRHARREVSSLRLPGDGSSAR